ncbi:hypothetical protein BC830DRAFT_740267 [Chytriomyces sp. MP71]|nr:hypothetical protein BC830DRAFT_740267 [Chytriomyces sp. MP71]
MDGVDDGREQLLARHRKEAKELQGKITGLKKAASSDKKKDLPDVIAQLEAELKDRHAQDVADFDAAHEQTSKPDAAAKSEAVESGANSNLTTTDSASVTAAAEEPAVQTVSHRKPNRQQQRKAKKAANFEEQRRLAELEAANTVNMKDVEDDAINSLVSLMNLSIKQINADGHCLYSAISDQIALVTQQDSLGYAHYRKVAANFMRANADDFTPFLLNEKGDMMSSGEYETYCSEVESSATWGGQLEIKAISSALKREINIVQMGSPVLKIGEEFGRENLRPLMLSYHRHYYGLGEHYNSLIVAA